MTFAEIVQLVNAGGVLVFAWFVLTELRLIRPLLSAITLYLASEASPEERDRLRKLTPPVGTGTPGPGG